MCLDSTSRRIDLDMLQRRLANLPDIPVQVVYTKQDIECLHSSSSSSSSSSSVFASSGTVAAGSAGLRENKSKINDGGDKSSCCNCGCDDCSFVVGGGGGGGGLIGKINTHRVAFPDILNVQAAIKQVLPNQSLPIIGTSAKKNVNVTEAVNSLVKAMKDAKRRRENESETAVCEFLTRSPSFLLHESDHDSLVTQSEHSCCAIQ